MSLLSEDAPPASMPPPRILALSCGDIPHESILVAKLDALYFNFEQALPAIVRRNCIALWLRDGGDDPIYFSYGTPDAEIITQWACVQQQDYLLLPGTLFQLAALVDAVILGPRTIMIAMEGDALPWQFPVTADALRAVRNWQNSLTALRPAL
jgi:hypothetical protein